MLRIGDSRPQLVLDAGKPLTFHLAIPLESSLQVCKSKHGLRAHVVIKVAANGGHNVFLRVPLVSQLVHLLIPLQRGHLRTVITKVHNVSTQAARDYSLLLQARLLAAHKQG